MIFSSESKEVKQVPFVSKKLIEGYQRTKNTSQNILSAELLTTQDIYEVPWRNLTGVEHLDTSAFAVHFPQQKALVVKGSQSIVQDYFSYLVSSVLQVKTPLTRLVQYTDPEFKLMLNSLRSKAYSDFFLDNKISRELDRPFLVVMEYIPSVSLRTLDRNQVSEVFSKDSERLRQLGNTLALDLFLNNSDRIPLIWNNEGNPNNFLVEFRETFGNLVAIDSSCFCISNSQMMYQDYLERLFNYVKTTFEDLEEIINGRTLGKVSIQSMDPVKEFFEKHLSVSLNNSQLFQVLKGMVKGFFEVSQVEETQLLEVYESTRQYPSEDKLGFWQAGMASINLRFLRDTKAIIEKLTESHSENTSWVLSTYESDESPLYY